MHVCEGSNFWTIFWSLQSGYMDSRYGESGAMRLAERMVPLGSLWNFCDFSMDWGLAG